MSNQTTENLSNRDLRINNMRLWDSLMDMAKIGPGIAGGNNRQTLTDEDAEGRKLFKSWCEQAGLTMGLDSMGNMFARRDGTDPDSLPVYVGSHLDTQPTGGKYDGVLGVLAGLELVRTLNDLDIKTRHPIIVTNWTNEEGTRFPPAMVSSGVFAGTHTQEWAYARKDADGKTLGDELKRLNLIGDEPVGARKMKAFYELHIEQGPILEAEGKDIGVVTHGQGLNWIQVEITGKESHTGSTPMPLRHNAGLGMARILNLVDEIAYSHAPDAVGAAGHIDVYPNSRNVIPGRVVFTVDFRSPNIEVIAAMVDRLKTEAPKICEKMGLGISFEQVGGFDPVTFDKDCVQAVRSAAEKLGYSHRDIISGAGHDACWINRVAPTAMVMCPCVDGLSHNEAEEITQDWASAAQMCYYMRYYKPRKLWSKDMSTVIKNGTVCTADRSYKADVLIEGETIAEIGQDLKGDKTIDAEGAYVIPGGIDPHTHLEMPFMGTTAAETFESGTWAAAAGGTTMVIDFCLPGADGSIKNAIQEWHRKSAPQICSDIGYHMAITGWNENIFEEMKDAVDMGINSFKHFMAYKGALMIEDDEMFASFKRCAELGAMPMVHAENGDLVAELQTKYFEQGITGPEGHAYSRPPELEGEAANRAITIADTAGVPLYIVHVSCEQAHEAIRRARQKGMRVYGEPLIQFLTLDESEYFNKDWDHAARRVMSPPFRSKDHQDSLWAGLQSGSLQVVATDHAAFNTEQKRAGRNDFRIIPNGSNGLEERLAVLWTQGVETGRLTPNEFVAVTSSNIAKILNIYPKKGALVVGADADIVVWDPKISKTISPTNHHSVLDYNVFEGFEVTAQSRYTLSRGDVIWAWGQNSQPQPGRGRFVPRPAFPSAHQALSKWNI